MLKTREELQEAILSTGNIGYNDKNLLEKHKVKILYYDMKCGCGGVAFTYMYEDMYYYTCNSKHATQQP